MTNDKPELHSNEVLVDSRTEAMFAGKSRAVYGVYMIRCLENERFYIGSSTDIMARWQRHRSHLRTGTHKSKLLQADWTAFGIHTFVFSVLRQIDPLGRTVIAIKQELLKEESKFISELKPYYNTLAQAGTVSGYTHSDEAKQKMHTTQRKTRSDKGKSKIVYPVYGFDELTEYTPKAK